MGRLSTLQECTGCGVNVTNPRSAVGIIAPVPAGTSPTQLE